MSTKWANLGKLQIKSVPENGNIGSGSRPPIQGTFDAAIQTVVPTVFKSGGFGIKLTYFIQSEGDVKGRKVFENLVFVTGKGTLNDFGMDLFAARLTSLGLTNDEVLAFEIPQDDNDFGDIGKLIGKKLQITVDSTETYRGRPSPKITGSAPIGAEVKE